MLEADGRGTAPSWACPHHVVTRWHRGQEISNEFVTHKPTVLPVGLSAVSFYIRFILLCTQGMPVLLDFLSLIKALLDCCNNT